MRIEMRGIDKSFGSNQVLKQAGFTLESGEVHALMGENGAGKSTLMKILTGVYTKDAGTVLVDGKEVNYKNPQEAEKAGIVFIYQELNVMFDLTVEENLFMGKEIHGKFGICDKKAMQKKAQEALNILGVNISPKTVMAELSVGQQQMVEICKALMADAKVIIMDEPTAALTQSETVALFKVIESLRKKGVSMVYISHRMEEIFELCDRITVLRDGSYIGVKNIPETNMNEIVKMMIGREIGERYPSRNVKIGKEVLKVKELTRKGTFHDVNFSVRAGEVLGVSGLMGAGRTEIMQAIFGNLSYESGTIEIDGKEVKISNPRQAMEHGIGFITEDRNTVGGDVEAGLAIAEMIASLSIPTVSLVLGGGHSIGVPMAVSADYSFAVPSATMVIHPVRSNGMFIGVAQTYRNMEKIQDRITTFISEHSKASQKRLEELMLDTSQLVKDVGTMLEGKEAVKEGLIDEVGGIKEALAKLYEMIEKEC